MSRNFLGAINVQAFERIIHFMQENNIPTTQIIQIDFDEDYFSIPTETVSHNFDILLPDRPTTHVSWAGIDHVNSVLSNGDIIQILDVTQLPKDEQKTVFYIQIPKPEVD